MEVFHLIVGPLLAVMCAALHTQIRTRKALLQAHKTRLMKITRKARGRILGLILNGRVREHPAGPDFDLEFATLCHDLGMVISDVRAEALPAAEVICAGIEQHTGDYHAARLAGDPDHAHKALHGLLYMLTHGVAKPVADA